MNIGTIIHGTLRPEDLIPALLEAARTVDTEDETRATLLLGPIHARLTDETWTDVEGRSYFESEYPMWDLEDLIDYLNEHAPPYCYFGAHQGDGSDFGCWPDHDSIDDDLIKVSDLSELKPDYRGDVCIINDHGNMTVGRVSTSFGYSFTEYWSVV